MNVIGVRRGKLLRVNLMLQRAISEAILNMRNVSRTLVGIPATNGGENRGVGSD